MIQKPKFNLGINRKALGKKQLNIHQRGCERTEKDSGEKQEKERAAEGKK